MRTASLMVLALALLAGGAKGAIPGGADPLHVEAPDIKVGDAWSFDQTDDRGAASFDERRTDLKIERQVDDTMIVGIKIAGAPGEYEDHVVGRDWSMRRVIDGKQKITAQAFAFPLTLGKTWTSEYDDTTRHGRQTLARHRLVSKVVGWETVTVPAGTFHALRIESVDTIAVHLEATSVAGGGAVSTVSGATSFAGVRKQSEETIYQTALGSFLYVPAVRYFVRREEELFNSDNIRQGHILEVLTSYKLLP